MDFPSLDAIALDNAYELFDGVLRVDNYCGPEPVRLRRSELDAIRAPLVELMIARRAAGLDLFTGKEIE